MLWAVTDPELWGRKANKDWAATWKWQEAHMEALLERDKVLDGITAIDRVSVKDTIRPEDIVFIYLADSSDKDRIKTKLESALKRSGNYDAIQHEVKSWLVTLKEQAVNRAKALELKLSILTTPLVEEYYPLGDFEAKARAEAREIQERRNLAEQYLPARGVSEG